MNVRQVSRGLGWFSIALGLTEIFGAARITRALGAEGKEALVRGYGAREIIAGVGLLDAPMHEIRMWNRVGGDGLDLATLAPLAARNPRSKAVWGAVAFVIGATAIDVLAARALGRKPDPSLGAISGPATAAA